MRANRRPRASRALLTLVFGLALLGPGAAGRAAFDQDASTSLAAGPVVGLGQGLIRERARSLFAPFGKRDDPERPGLALPGLLAAAGPPRPGPALPRPSSPHVDDGAARPRPARDELEVCR
jgi:hypothetical protein